MQKKRGKKHPGHNSHKHYKNISHISNNPLRKSLNPCFEIPYIECLPIAIGRIWTKINSRKHPFEIDVEDPFIILRFKGFWSMKDFLAFNNEFRNTIEPFMFRNRSFHLLINISKFPIQIRRIRLEWYKTIDYCFSKGLKGNINLIDNRYSLRYLLRHLSLTLKELKPGIAFFGSEKEAIAKLQENEAN